MDAPYSGQVKYQLSFWTPLASPEKMYSVDATTGLRKYAWSCIWLIVPPMLILAMVSPLPRAYQTDLFWADIPRWIGRGENLTRAIVVGLPAFMPLGINSRTQKMGVVLYVLGLGMYWFAWRSQVWFAGTTWVSHPAGFMAPAWTPLVWLTGIGLIGERLYFSDRYRPWMYFVATLAFLSCHILHAWIVWLRTVAIPAG